MRTVGNIIGALFVVGVAGWAFVLWMLIFPVHAHALDASVRSACTSDYLSLCFGTVPGSASCRRCFVVHGPYLSNECRAAIRGSAEFGSQYRTAARLYHKKHGR